MIVQALLRTLPQGRWCPKPTSASVVLDAKAGELWKGARRLRLQEKSLKLLLALIEQPNQIQTREELRLRLWPPNASSTSTMA